MGGGGSNILVVSSQLNAGGAYGDAAPLFGKSETSPTAPRPAS
jgi:hypothetical protein